MFKPAASFLIFVLCIVEFVEAAPANPPTISYKNGKLHYSTGNRGNRIPDFSHCGYAGGDRPIPMAPVRVVVAPVPGDSTSRIQRALDHVAGLPPDTNGIRGAVLLLRGRHEVLGGLQITNSGVVLRGQGMNEDGTVLVAAGLDRRTLIRFVGQNDCVTRTNAGWQIADTFVPVGAVEFHVSDANGLRPGAAIRVIRPSTQKWIEALGMVDFGGEEGGVRWKPGSRDLAWDRTLRSVDGNRITIDAPITTAIEQDFGGGHVETYSWPGRIRNVGVENIRLESTFDQSNRKDENHSWCAITMENTSDAWVRQITFKHFAASAVAIYETCKQVTVEDCLALEPISEEGGCRRNTFFTMGQLTLFLKCYSEHGRHDFSVGHCAAGPNAFVQCDSHLSLADSGPIDSWASGVLFDNVRIDGNALTLGHRGNSNQGAGWSAANCVLWQCSAAVIRCYNPPTAQNWSFGSWAGFEGDGLWRSSNDFVSPDSLFAEQLRNRIGTEASDRLQLMPRPRDESSNPPIDRAQQLADEARKPAPSLSDFIAAAPLRNPIPSEPGNAIRVEELAVGKPQPSPANAALVATNGWLAINGKLLIGGTAGVTWWRGSVRPNEASNFGLNITRFVPGRIGPGFTDDLNQVAANLIKNGHAALDYNHGLWYDRRRDDHQRVRRMDGDVWPPFYEQPFARVGQHFPVEQHNALSNLPHSTAWDGLSKYDLTRFNPWYWTRLKEFGDICERRGLVFFHQNYFQHNILEAGAHWADSPWRTANNINNTDFPEPPNYAGDKRIFMAELFYDVNHPVRRELHRRYIRQCLENFGNNPNVIQFTSAEFTGPLHFIGFWLDTVAAWKSGETSIASGPLIALSTTKDVQDAILADVQRNDIVDVIDFRYWWRTGKGQFAPPGGKNLAPRQFERQWRGGRPTDTDLAEMAFEYRTRFPAKPVICNFESAGWAWLCAGGSMPRLPMTTDEQLLAAIPKMTPWIDATTKDRWALRESGKQMLVYSEKDFELDMSNETGSFRVREINLSTGEVIPGISVRAGGNVTLPRTRVVWLIREN